MTTVINISVESNPVNGVVLDFTITGSLIGYSKTISKTFVSGTPSSVNEIQIGATTVETLGNIYDNFAANEVDASTSFGMLSTYFNIVFAVSSSYSVAVTDDADGSVTVMPELIEEEEVYLPLLVINKFAIEIINNYTNEMALVEEFTQVDSPTLVYDGGDEIYTPIKSSKLSFNLLVDDAADGKFDHLFTGDELQFLVKLYNIDEEDNSEIVWQGFLMPEVYREPYKNGAFFVEFTAIDMLTSLKYKTLKPWYYNNRIPVGLFLAFLLKNTGLSQEIIVAPSILPDDDALTFNHINVPLAHYYKDNKYENCYQMLEDFLTANALTLHSFREKWFVTGITRIHEEIKEQCIVYSVNGIYNGLVNITERVKQPMMELSPPMIGLIPPFKKVNVDLTIGTKKKLFSEESVVAQVYSTYKVANLATDGLFRDFLVTPFPEGALFSPDVVYWTTEIKEWTKVGDIAGGSPPYGTMSIWGAFNDRLFLQQFRISYGDLSSDVTEAMALEAYFECPEHPSVEAGAIYRFKYKINKVALNGVTYNADDMNDGVYDQLVPFQLFIADNEFISIRPGFENPNHRYSYNYQAAGSGGLLDFTIDTEFTAPISGPLTFRMLAPITTGDDYEVFDFRYISEFNIELVEDKANEKISSVRSINFTNEKDIDIKFISAESEAIKNNFGLGFPTNSVYEKNIAFSTSPADVEGSQVWFTFTTSPLHKVMELKSFQTTTSIYDELIFEKLNTNIFSRTVAGVEKSMVSWYFYTDEAGVKRMAYLTDYDDGVDIPKTYKKESVLNSTDVLKYIDFDYATEDLSKRANWKLFGHDSFVSNKEFNKVLSRVYHFTRPSTMLSIECDYLDLIFPNDIIEFEYKGEIKKFGGTSLTLNLSKGKTRANMNELKFEEVIDIDYEY